MIIMKTTEASQYKMCLKDMSALTVIISTKLWLILKTLIA